MIKSYDELPIGKYQSIIEALRQNTDDIDGHVAMLAIMYDMTMDEVYDLPLEKYQEMSKAAVFLIRPLPAARGRICKEYKLGNLVLVPTTDVKKFTAAQFIDYQQMIKEDGRLVELCSTILVPKGHTYAKGYDMADVHQAIAENLSVTDVMELSAFFLRSLKGSISRTLNYLEGLAWLTMKKEERKELHKMLKELRDLLKDGDGWRILTQSQQQRINRGMILGR